ETASPTSIVQSRRRSRRRGRPRRRNRRLPQSSQDQSSRTPFVGLLANLPRIGISECPMPPAEKLRSSGKCGKWQVMCVLFIYIIYLTTHTHLPNSCHLPHGGTNLVP